MNKTLIKLFADSEIAINRITRAENLKHLTPELLYKGKNIYSYEWIPGQTLYDYDDVEVWTKFLGWCKDSLWHAETYDIKSDCKVFYKDKTLKRLDSFLNMNRDNLVDASHIINGKQCKSINHYLNKINWDYLFDGVATKYFHGDLQFDNIIYDDQNFYLIDWRQSFGNSTEYGDVYYDLAKLYGGILMSYKSMKEEENYKLTIMRDQVDFSFNRTKNLIRFEDAFTTWVKNSGYDFDKVKKITALIYLNMAPLHEKKFGDLLFCQSKLLLEECYG